MRCERLFLKDYYSFLGDNGKNSTLDLYLPFNMDEMNRQNRKRPCIVICPGGGYGFVSQREAEALAVHFITEGFNAFVLTYSIAPHTFPSQMLEVAAVMELIHKSADEWNCDTDKILIMGSSAGGHLAAHYSTMFDCKEVREYFPDSKAVAGTVLNYPVITSNQNYWHGGSFKNLLGKADLTDDDTRYFSCELNVKETTPPAFIWHTAEDGCVPVMNSLLYAQALSNNKVPFELHIYPFGGHGLSTADIHTVDAENDVTRHVSGWLFELKKWLKLMGFTY